MFNMHQVRKVFLLPNTGQNAINADSELNSEAGYWASIAKLIAIFVLDL